MKKVIIISYFISLMYGNYVTWEPQIPVPGGDITIIYDLNNGELSSNPFIHIGYNGWVDVGDYPLDYSGSSFYEYTYSIPEDAETVDFVFFSDVNNNGQGDDPDIWDNNGGFGIDWHISLNYYWAPFNPSPNDDVEITLNNIVQGGHIVWSVDTGAGLELPIEDYWPDDSYVVDNELYSPLIEENVGVYQFFINKMQSGEQIVQSIKFKILWEDGNWDVGTNGQIILYDIYFDYTIDQDLGDPYIFFNQPTQDASLLPPIDFQVFGSAEFVEFWIKGELIGQDSSSSFEASWNPGDTAFGDYKIAAKAVSSSGRVSYIFRDIYLEFEIIEEALPLGIDDGINIDENIVTISLFAPEKDYVALKGSWNSEYTNGELMKLSDDTWWYQTTLPDGQYTYQFNVSYDIDVNDENYKGDKLIADPWSKDVIWVNPNNGLEDGYYENAFSVINVGQDEFVWNDQNFSRPNQSDLIIYELLVSDFKGSSLEHGTYQDVIDRIEDGYFEDLGINAIELMPITEFEGAFSWGYNTTFPMAPESSYGSPEDLKTLINIAHQHDIAVLLDVVYNHLWGSSPLFQLYQPPNDYEWDHHDFDRCPYFDNQESEWGYKLNHWNDRTQKYIEDALMMWVEDYHIDGFRFDYTPGIGWDPSGNYGVTYYGSKLSEYDDSLLLIAEEDNSYQINLTDFDSGWDYSYYHTLYANLMQTSQSGASWGNMDYLAGQMHFQGQGYQDSWGAINYIESHDENRLTYAGNFYENMTLEYAHKRSQLGAVVLFTGQGVPMIYHGQEFGQFGTSREGETIIPQPLQWENLDNSLGQETYALYSKLIKLRSEVDVLRGAHLEFKYQDSDAKVLSYWRIGDNQKAIIVANFDDQDHAIDLEFPNNGIWYDYLNDSEINIESNYYGGYLVPQATGIIFLSELPESENCNHNMDINFDGITNILDVVQTVNFVLGTLTFNDNQICNADINLDGIVNILDIITTVNLILN